MVLLCIVNLCKATLFYDVFTCGGVGSAMTHVMYLKVLYLFIYKTICMFLK